MVFRVSRMSGCSHDAALTERPLDRGGGRIVRRRHGERARMSSKYSLLRGNGQLAYAHWGDVSDNGSPNDGSLAENCSSSDDDTVIPRRKRVLDDALFEFFSKEAIKTLKRDFSKFCRDSDIWPKSKRAKVNGIGKHSFSAYGAKYFFEVLHRLTDRQKSVIEKRGFGCLLALGQTYIPSSFIRWLALCVDPDSSQIIVNDKILNISKYSFHFVLGLPNHGSEVVENSDGGLDLIMSIFHLSDVPHITFFGDKLNSSEDLTDQEVFLCFMQVVVSCFLCPSGKDRLDTKYMQQLGDPERASGFDLCRLMHKHFILGINKTIKFIKNTGRKPKVFEFCSYALAVYYLDCLDFGLHIAGTGFPRSVSWRGDMIIEYSELDRKSKRCFGRRPMRKDLTSCYYNVTSSNDMNGTNRGEYELMSTHIKETMHNNFGMTLSGKTIDGIFDVVQSSILPQPCNNNKPESLVCNILKFLADARPWYKCNNNLQADLMKTPVGNIAPASKAEAAHIDTTSVQNQDTPDCIITKAMDTNSSMTAPEMHPLVKVKSRLTIQLPESHPGTLGQSDLVSPIGRMNLSPQPVNNDHAKVLLNPVTQNMFAKNSKGSQQAPIPVGDTTPTAPTVVKSPELTITGTSSFKERQNQLAMDADREYNKTIHPVTRPVGKSFQKTAASLQVLADVVDLEGGGRNVAAAGQNNGKQPAGASGLIIINPRKNLVFPLAHNSRYPVSDDDIMHYCAIVELAYTERVQKEYALKYHGVHCSWISLGQSLVKEGHVDNFLIPCFCRKLFEDKHPSKSGRHYFFSCIGESILELSNSVHESIVRTSLLGAASASRGKRLDFSDQLFFPICHLKHWFVFVVDFKWRVFAFLDSLYSPQSDYQLAVRRPLMDNFEFLWKKIFDIGPDFKTFNVMTPNVPKQRNPHDCGVFAVKSMESWHAPKDLTKVFSEDDIGHIRIQYANLLFFHVNNQVDRSSVTNFYVKDDFVRLLH